MLRPLTLALCCSLLGCASAPPPAATSPVQNLAPGAALDAALAGDWRRPQDVLRDRHRHPGQTLAFFGVQPDATVIEITPGGGWYTDILAPYLRDRGRYIGALPAATAASAGDKRNLALRAKLAGNADVYGDAELRIFDPASPAFGPAGSADTVLTFRNVHNWVSAGNADAYFRAFFAVLRPGGVLGVVDHRARQGSSLEAMKKSGYLTEALVIELARRAGFQLVGSSEVNANPADTADHPNGVWTLPPTNRHDAADDAKYQAIGESDRMTLKFRKPQ
jgi:predicted methyltransferase